MFRYLPTFFIAVGLLVLLHQDAFSQEKKDSCDRKLLEGFWEYRDIQGCIMYRLSDKVGEILGTEILIKYKIRWKDGYNHDLIVIEIIQPPYLPTVYKIGDVIHITVLEVTPEYYRYDFAFKDKVYKNGKIYRQPKESYEWLFESKTL